MGVYIIKGQNKCFMKIWFRISLLSILLALGTANLAHAQSKRKSSNEFTDKLWYGGGFGLGLSGNTFNIGVSPMVGYKIVPSWSAGLRVPFEYTTARLSGSDGSTVRYNDIDWGLGTFTRVKFFRSLFAHAEYNYLWVQEPVSSGGGFFIDPENPNRLLKQNLNEDELNIGLGYSSGNTIGYEISLLYNVLEDPNSIQQPWTIRVGFNYNF